uniref:Uncharacterized protein n=1 Tax=Salix viminalis TaxID=40686 RepID=A0A6N2K6P4_SALVM
MIFMENTRPRYCYLCLMSLKDQEMGTMWWLEGLLLHHLEKESLLLLLASVKLWVHFLIKRLLPAFVNHHKDRLLE